MTAAARGRMRVARTRERGLSSAKPIPELRHQARLGPRNRGSSRDERCRLRQTGNAVPSATGAMPERARSNDARSRVRLNRSGNGPSRVRKAGRVRPRPFVRPHPGRRRARRIDRNARHRSGRRRNANGLPNGRRHRRRAMPGANPGRTRGDAPSPVHAHSSGASLAGCICTFGNDAPLREPTASATLIRHGGWTRTPFS